MSDWRSTAKVIVLRTCELPARVPWRRSGLRVRVFGRWNDTLDQALDALPEQRVCDHETWRTLLHDTPAPKRHALVTDRDDVIGIVSLRRRQHYWEPVAEHCLPFAIAPAVDGRLNDVIAALGVEVRCSSLDRLDGLSPTASWPFTTYGADLRADYEAHWRTSSLWKSVRRARDKTAHLDVRVGEASDIDWVLDNWANRWRGDPLQMVNAMTDRRRAWHHLHSIGRLLVVGLADHEQIVAGRVAVGIGDELFDQTLGRDDDYPNRFIGTRIDDAGYQVAAAAGWGLIDLSGYHDEYKARWAPPLRERYSALFQPRWRRVMRLSSAPTEMGAAAS